MKVLVTGSSGHLGEGLVRTLRMLGHDVAGLDLLDRPFTTHVGSILDRAHVRQSIARARVVFHAATLHKPHLNTHGPQDFIDTNLTGTLTLLEEAVAAGVESFIFTSTTSVFGHALMPPPGTPAAWITEDVVPIPKNIYGVTKAAAEDLCELFHRNHGLACLVLRTSRFFPEEDDDPAARADYADENLKVNEFLFRRVEISDVVRVHLLAADRAPALGFRKYIISATTPFIPGDMEDVRADAARMVRNLFPEYQTICFRRGWKMLASMDRVYVNDRAREELGWRPRYDFQFVIDRLKNGEDFRSPLARLVGSKGYHAVPRASPVSGVLWIPSESKNRTHP